MNSARTFAILMVCALLPHGCRSGAPADDWARGYSAAEVLLPENPALQDELRQKVMQMYPPDLRAVHRVVLKVRGGEFNLTGYVLARAGGEARLLAAADLEGTAFEVLQPANGPAQVLKNASGLRTSALERGAARDLAVLYLRRPSPASRLLWHGDDVIGLAEDLPDGVRQEFRFDMLRRRPIGYVLSRRGQCLYHVEYSEEGLFPLWPSPTPHRVKIVDHVLGYALSIRVVDLRPQSIPDAAFTRGP
jgi:hypothetical protein